ncbi:DUF1361 domain-containing protein [uncultured Ilyobacter sp.]|uniref:DUF1361 domain-containing protein n=1 Tax=uncultured Ilyobacter sp. TaxID=544433 RepID=UPI0037481504
MTPFNKIESTKPTVNLMVIILFLSLSSCIMLTIRTIITSNYSYMFLIWSMILACIPLALSLFLIKYYKKKFIKITAGFIWIIFYPKAPYMITDFIHYRMFFNKWYDFLVISLSIFTGVLTGFLSLLLLQKLIEVNFGKLKSWKFVILINILASYGIYLGRFIRLNSLEIITNPSKLINGILNSLNIDTFFFTLVFSFFLMLIYIAFYNILYFDRKNNNNLHYN